VSKGLACAVVICKVCEALGVAVAEVRGQFGTPGERKRPQLEFSKPLLNNVEEDITLYSMCVIMNFEVQSRAV
jgi:hypothetical protein